MTPVRPEEAATVRIKEIYRYSRERWVKARADAHIEGMFQIFDGIATGSVASHPVSAEFGVEGCFSRSERYYIYWKTLGDGAIGIVTVLHERMHQFGRFLEDQES